MTGEELQESLQSIGVNVSDFKSFVTTDRGEVFTFATPGGDPAVHTWMTVRGQFEQTKHWPVLMGPEEELEQVLEGQDFNDSSASETLEFARTINPLEWFSAREEDAEIPEGRWPLLSKPQNTFITPFDILSRLPHPTVRLALVPVNAAWEVPALLQLGNWNACPEAAVHCALHKYWETEYGAEIVAATGDVIEMRASRPPTTRDAAMKLALQQYLYCADIVDQGTETIAKLASGLLNGTSWYFWWD